MLLTCIRKRGESRASGVTLSPYLPPSLSTLSLSTLSLYFLSLYSLSTLSTLSTLSLSLSTLSLSLSLLSFGLVNPFTERSEAAGGLTRRWPLLPHLDHAGNRGVMYWKTAMRS